MGSSSPPEGEGPDARRRNAVRLGAALALLVVAVVVAVLLWPDGERDGDGDGREGPGIEAEEAVTAENTRFDPAEVSVPIGRTLVFLNRDQVRHTFTADGALFDSGPVDPGGSFRHEFATPRTVAYHCEIHPSMRGTITVTPR